MEIVHRIGRGEAHDPCATQPTHDLGENVHGYLAPREVPPEGGHCDRHRGVDVTPGDASCYPRTQGEADGESEVDRQGVLNARGEVKVSPV